MTGMKDKIKTSIFKKSIKIISDKVDDYATIVKQDYKKYAAKLKDDGVPPLVKEWLNKAKKKIQDYISDEEKLSLKEQKLRQ